MKSKIVTAVLVLLSFIAGAAMRPMSKPSRIFRRPYEVSNKEPIPGPFLHVCLCGQKIACAFEHNVIGEVLWEWANMKDQLETDFGVRIISPRKEKVKHEQHQ